MRHILLPAIVLAATLSGCGTLIDKTYQEVHVSTPGVEGAECFLDTQTRKYRVLTPNTFIAERAPHNLMITCQKPMYHDAVQKVDYQIKPWYSLLSPPLIPYDVADNSIYAYPKHIEIMMEEDTAAITAAQAQFEKKKSEVKKKERPVDEVAEPDVTPKGEKSFDDALRK